MINGTKPMDAGSDQFRFNSLLTMLIASALLLSAHLGYLFLADANRFPISTVKVVANYDHITREQLENILNTYLKASFFSLSIKHLQNDLLAQDWVEKVYLARVWPDTLKITLVEKIPVAVWNNSLLTASGKVFNVGKIEDEDQLPILKGPDQQSKEVLQIYQKLSKLLSIYGLKAVSLQLYENQSWEMALSNGVQLRLGKKDIDKRLIRFCRSYPAIFADKRDQLAIVDLRYPRGMAVQWKEGNSN